ncbi:hypothetical protein CXB51_008489 [Gossypium anomalum]|uniref:Uncharacterized protein n=1 Tax=Gossypium anomalum TaxID=47600 RepID=A0A8J5Z040_9ROSI|nr:hypothetical protein CXB51_008489 [Gossypium anomalum]
MDRSKSTSMEKLVGMEIGWRLGESYMTRLGIGLKGFKDLLKGGRLWLLSCERFYMD